MTRGFKAQKKLTYPFVFLYKKALKADIPCFVQAMILTEKKMRRYNVLSVMIYTFKHLKYGNVACNLLSKHSNHAALLYLSGKIQKAWVKWI